MKAFLSAFSVVLLVVSPALAVNYNYSEAVKVDANGATLPLTSSGNTVKSIAFTNGVTVNKANIGATKEFYISLRTDNPACVSTNVCGSGTKLDPYDGSTVAKMEAVLASIPTNSYIQLGVGTFPVSKHSAVTNNIKAGWTMEGQGESTVIQMVDNLAGIHFLVTPLSSPYNSPTDGVTLRNFVVDGNWPGNGPTADDGTGGSGTVADGVTANGSATIKSASSKFDKSYLFRTVSGAGVPSNTRIARSPATTIAAASDGVTLPQATINVVSAADFATAGTFFISNATGFQVITYTGKTGASFTGCSGGTGKINKTALVSTVTQLVMDANATATGTVTLNFGGQKRACIGGIHLYGSNNLIDNVHIKNNYGSYQNSFGVYGNEAYETFAIQLDSPTTGPAGKNNHIRHVTCDSFYGDYVNGPSIVGISARQPATECSIEDLIVTGEEWPFKPGHMNTGGGGFVENCQFIGAQLRWAGYAHYIDTGSMKNCLFRNYQTYGMTGGIYLVASGDATWTMIDVTYDNCQFDIMNMQLNTGDASNALRINSYGTTNLKINNCRFMQRTGGMGGTIGHALLLADSVNPQFFGNRFDTDGVFGAAFHYAAYTNSGIQFFSNRKKDGTLITADDGMLDNVNLGASNIVATGDTTTNTLTVNGNVSGNFSGASGVEVDADNVHLQIRHIDNANYTILVNGDFMVVSDRNLTSHTWTLPDPILADGKTKILKDGAGDMAPGRKITISPDIEGATLNLVKPYERYTVSAYGGAWHVEGHYAPGYFTPE